LDEVNEENAQLNEQLSVALMENNHKTKEMEEIEQECEELELEIARNNKVQSAKREEATELKKKHNELQSELATARLALQEAQVEYDSLQSKVVSSPERRKKDLASLQEIVKEERNEANRLEDEWQKTKTIIVHVSQAIKDVQETTRVVQEVLEGTMKLSLTNDEIQDAKMELGDITKETNDLVQQVQTSEANLHRSEEKLAHMRKQYKLKMDAAQDAFDAAKLQLLQVEQEHAEGMARVEAGEAEVKAMEARMEAERQITQKDIDDMIAQYRIMEQNVLDQNESFMAAIQAA